ncbi:hypothetical protein B0A48_15819 [Cryoendolithus antarcticus]|uniref:Uncharacterized protein n=1 Tax=Cryoendolithus antarcticus TaxID=1507870 RepID=A0A1V8SHP4_9PEZI|nr:hypothetical protein B0A48_15819 [Cryoendolithus antarcticus]OQO28152.1 hypothetical protein B0A51_05692 [Rachicladosporium sp. CCFEE 5018]
MTDFANLQNYIASIRAAPSAEEYNEDGYVLLRHCEGEAKALLSQGFTVANGQRGDEEQQKLQLRRIIIDASVRRHRAKKIYARATAALRWVNARNALLQGQRAHAGHAPALQQIRNNLRVELTNVTDAAVDQSLRSADNSVGKWISEDPPLAVIQRVLTGSC